MIKKAGSLFITAYLLLIFGVYPFYMNQGYVDIGKAKYRFFICSSFAALLILALMGGVLGVQIVCRRIRQHEPYLINWDSLSVTDMFVLMFATELFISFASSDYRREAWRGTEGWYMGLALLLTLCGLYFFISRFWDGGKAVWHVGAAASGIVFLLGILDRFSVYVIPIEIREPAFISTLGNINWFCGYLSVVAPVGICLFMFGKGRGRLYGIYAAIVFMAGFCQGGSSIFLFFGALFYILLWMAVKKREWLEKYFLLLSVWGFSAQGVRILRYIWPEGYNYDRDNLCAYLTASNGTLFLGAAALAGYTYLRVRGKGPVSEKAQCLTHKCMVGILAAGIILWSALTGLNTWQGIPQIGQSGVFLINKAWGNGRGAAFYSSIQMYVQMPVFHKLFGAGPDCFSAYAYSLPEVAAGLRDSFGGDRLTNAHNEILTCLINWGILGVCLFAGIFVSFAKRCMKKGGENPELYLFVVCAVCYFTHNMVSFAQVLNFPFLFLLLGMGEGLIRRQGYEIFR